ncbi:MAG: TRAP transporter substrate-binding protein [Castellaniella sp.]
MNKRFKTSLLAACLMAGLGLTSVASAQKWDMPVRSNMQNYFTRNLVQFSDDVKAATNGKFDIVIHPEDSLVKQPDVKRAVQTGQVPIGELLMSMHSNENAVFGIDSVPFLTGNYEQGSKLLDATRPYLTEILAKQGLKLLNVVPWPYNSFYSQDKLTSVSDFKGSKFRAFNPVTGRLAELMGATPVTVQQSEVSQAFSTGVINAMITSPATGVDTQAWDFVKYFTDVRAMAPWNILVVNQKAFDKLGKDEQAALLKASDEAETRGWKMAEEETGKLIQMLKDHGMTVDQPSDAMKAEFGPIHETLISEWIASAPAEGKTIVDAYNKVK